jgi:hypothetical protein
MELPQELQDAPTYESLRAFEAQTASSFERSRLEDAITALVTKNPGLGVRLLQGVAQDHAWESVLASAARYGLERSRVPQDLWLEVLVSLELYPDTTVALSGVSSVLLAAIEREPVGIPVQVFSEAAEAIVRLTTKAIEEGQDVNDPGRDPLSQGLNTWPGRAVQFLVHCAGEIERSGGDPCATPGLDAFLRLVHANRGANWAVVATATLGRLFPYLWERCPEIVGETLLAAFSWENERLSLAAWQGLAYARWSVQTVNVLYDVLPTTAVHVKDMEHQAQEGLCYVLAGIATTYGRDPSGHDGWLTSLVRNNGDAIRARFAHFLRRSLQDLDEPRREAVWTSWLRQWWTRRLQGFPTAFGPDEGSIMLTWIFPLRAQLDEVLPLVLSLPVANRTFGFLHELARSDLPNTAPTEAARLVAHVLRHREQLWDYPDIEKALRAAQANGADAHALRDACNALVGLGAAPLDICPP